jgi:hypothetical protein
MATGKAWVWLILSISPCSAYGGNCIKGLSTQVADVSIEQPSALAALLQFGSENGVCFALESPGLDLIEQPGRISASRPSVAYVVQTLLGGARYQLSESHGVILIRNVEAMGRMTRLDVVVPEYKIPRMSVAWANLGLGTRLMRLADPSVQSIFGSLSNRLPNNQVGPMDEHGRTARELLTLIVSQSLGGAWVSGRCLGPVSSRVCWTIVEYRDDRETIAAMIDHIVHDLTAEWRSPK